MVVGKLSIHRLRQGGFWTLLVACALLGAFPCAALAENLSASDGSVSGNMVRISYVAYDDVRYPEQGDHYPLPTPDAPLDIKVRIDSLPPTQKDVDAYYQEFAGYDFIDADYYDGALVYFYCWHEMDRQKAEGMLRDYREGRPSEEELARDRELFKAGDWETLFASEDGSEEPSASARTQEELMAEAKSDVQGELDRAVAEGDLEEAQRLRAELDKIEQDEKDYAALQEASDGSSDESASAGISAEVTILVLAALTCAAIAAALAIRMRRRSSSSEI